MNFRFNISAGELFEMIRPTMLFLAAFLSFLVFSHSRKRFETLISLAWALATFALPAVVFPLYLAVILIRRRIKGPASPRALRFPIAIPALYLLTLLAFVSVYLLRDSASADTHLARATQARLADNTSRVIAEYRRALALDDDPHTRSLLASDLEQASYLTEALAELRLAERQGETDDLIVFRIATLLHKIDHVSEARLEYERFLQTKTCLKMSDRRCVEALERIKQLQQIEGAKD